MSNKLQNVKAVREMLEGTHKFQTKKTTGFSDADATSKKNERHEIGSVWEEKDPTSGLTLMPLGGAIIDATTLSQIKCWKGQGKLNN